MPYDHPADGARLARNCRPSVLTETGARSWIGRRASTLNPTVTWTMPGIKGAAIRRRNGAGSRGSAPETVGG